jgi:uncharacterized protein YjiS (DUF1127 family)
MTTSSHRLSRLPAALFRGYVRRSRERAAQAALQRLSDFELRDIGLDRTDIRRAVHFGHPARR